MQPFDAPSEDQVATIQRALRRSSGLAFFELLADERAQRELVRRWGVWTELGLAPALEIVPPTEAGRAELLARLQGLGERAPVAALWIAIGRAELEGDRALVTALNERRDRLH